MRAASWPVAPRGSRTSPRSTSPALSRGRGGPSGAPGSSTARRSPRPSPRSRPGRAPITPRGCAGYAELARALAERLAALAGARVELAAFTLDERLVDGPVNAVLLRGGGDLTGALAARDPSVRAMFLDDAVVFCTEALSAPEVPEVADAMSALWPN